MARLPQPGGDNGNWGTILNDYLSQTHKPDGTLKSDIVTGDALAADAVAAANIIDGSITETLLDASVQTKLNANSGTPDWNTLTNKPVVIAAGADQAAARAAIGAGTSNLVLGSTNTTAKAGDYAPTKSDVGLGNVDNTSDATKNAAAATLTNKHIAYSQVEKTVFTSPAYASSTTLAGSSTTTAAVPVPAGVTSNDIIVVYLYWETASEAITPPAGFTEAANSPAQATAPLRLSVYWKRATAADSGTYTFTKTGGGEYNAAVAVRYTGCITTGSPFDVTNSAVRNNTLNNTSPAVSATTTSSNALLVWVGALWATSTTTQPTGFAKRAEISSGLALAVADKTQDAAGATGFLQATFVANQQSAAWLGALKPVVSGTVLTLPDVLAGYQPLSSNLTSFAAKAVPGGVVVGTNDSQTLTNKTISGASNTLSNISADSLADGTTNRIFTSAEKTKLAGATMLPGYASGYYYLCNSISQTGTGAPVSGLARASMWEVTAPLTLSRMWFEFTTAGEANSYFRIGIWNDDGTFRPGTVALDAGTISTGSGNAGTVATGGTPGVYEITVSITLQPGIYWVGGASQNCATTPPTIRTVSGTGIQIPAYAVPISTTLPAANFTGLAFSQSGMNGALTSFTVPSGFTTTVARIGFKVA